MEGSVSIGTLIGVVGFILQVVVTVGAVAFSHGSLNQRVRALEENQREAKPLSASVTRLETEMESVGREIKGLRADLRALEWTAPPRRQRRQPPSPYDFPGARDFLDLGPDDEWRQ